MGAEGVGVGLLPFEGERVWGAQVSSTAQPRPIDGSTAPTAALSPLLLPRHSLQEADLLLFVLGAVPQLLPTRLTVEWVAFVWERGILLWQAIRDISKRVSLALSVREAWHLALGTPVWTHASCGQTRDRFSTV